MSIYLNCNLLSSVAFSAASRTVVSHSLTRRLRIATDKRLLLTTLVPGYCSLSTLVAVDFSKTLDQDISLGAEWSGHLRESLAFAGHPPPGLASTPALFSLCLPISSQVPITPHPHPDADKLQILSSHRVSSPLFKAPSLVPPPGLGQDNNYNGSSGLNGLSGSSSRIVPPVSADAPARSWAVSCHEYSLPSFADYMASVLLSPNNVFMAPLSDLEALLRSHHVPFDPDLTVSHALHAFLSHILSGSCVAFCPETSAPSKHRCDCSSFTLGHATRQSMAFEALSVVLSASADRLSDAHLDVICQALAIRCMTRVQSLNELGKRRT
ncbi:hypothetical protein DFH06DRAFT_1336519 [Mycena polygramma]|nr:hypothetical protein DFH06DRAFT_1336519 [Mycena polygramma]